ncbi:MAG: hypothetical protein OXC15_02010 [Rhodospirillaceae bacterium]|nr:hypothetical protein [Rhodospirillaceae bacterium]
MATKRTLNAANLEAVGARRLAELLVGIASGNRAARRRLRLELAAVEGPEALADEIRERLATIGRSRALLDWRKRRELAADLEIHRETIAERVAEVDAAEALELMWRLTELANPTRERCEDYEQMVIAVFRAAVADLGEIARAAGADPLRLADRAFEAATRNRHGQYNELIAVLAPALGQEGLERLKGRTIEHANAPKAQGAGRDRPLAERVSSGTDDEDRIAEYERRHTVQSILRDVADAQGDVDAYIVQHDAETGKVREVAAGFARRLLKAGRAEEALAALDEARIDYGNWTPRDFDWEDSRIDALEALGRPDEAQRVRWGCFERSLSAPHLRAYLRTLPDFDDMEAEEKALDHVLGFQDGSEALSFLVSWPALSRASRLVFERLEDIDGADDEMLAPAADALSADHPLAATMVLRAMIEAILRRGWAKYYKRAARCLLDCAGLSSRITDYGVHESHEAFEARLRRDHGRKESFWSLLA